MQQVIAIILKRLLDSRFYWSVVEGPLYNLFVYRVLDGSYDALLRTLAIPRGGNVLDVGSGAGQATLRLAHLHPESSIFGIDYAISQVRIAQMKRKYRKVKNLAFRIGDAMSLPFPKDAFDVVISLASIKHWVDEERGLSEIHRVLKAGGVAHIVECDGDATREEMAVLARRIAWFFPLRKVIFWYLEHVVFGQGTNRVQVSRFARSVGYRKVLVKRMEQEPFFHMVLRK